MRLFRYTYMAIALTGFLVLSGCHRRPLEDPDDFIRVKIEVDVDNIPNVTKFIYNDKVKAPEIKPEMMRVLFYSEDGNRIAVDTYFSDVKKENGKRVLSGDISILPGKYNILAYNFDTESILTRNDSRFSEIEAYTGAVTKNFGKAFSIKAPSPSSVVYEPDQLVVACEELHEIPYHQGIHKIQTTATSVVETYYLQIKVDGLQYVSNAQAILSGLVGSNKIALNERVNNPASVYFTLQKSKDKGEDVICAVFNTFGRIEDSANDLLVTFSIATVDGKIVQKPFEISNLFKTEDGRLRHWLLLDEKIKIDKPEKPVTGGGFIPEVIGWEEEKHTIEL